MALITQLTKKAIYVGFSTKDFLRTRKFVVTNVELVKRDLTNHIYTRRGERVMMPTFGTIIPDLVFEPLDDQTIQTVHDEVLNVIEFDPRVEILEFSVAPNYDAQSITTNARLRYIELNIIGDYTLNIMFEQG